MSLTLKLKDGSGYFNYIVKTDDGNLHLVDHVFRNQFSTHAIQELTKPENSNVARFSTCVEIVAKYKFIKDESGTIMEHTCNPLISGLIHNIPYVRENVMDEFFIHSIKKGEDLQSWADRIYREDYDEWKCNIEYKYMGADAANKVD